MRRTSPPRSVTVPLILLAIPSICAGWVIGPVLFGGYFGDAIVVAPEHDVLAKMAQGIPRRHRHDAARAHDAAVLAALAGIATAWYLYLMRPDLPRGIASEVRR